MVISNKLLMISVYIIFIGLNNDLIVLWNNSFSIIVGIIFSKMWISVK